MTRVSIMTTAIAALDFKDYAVLAAIVVIFAGVSTIVKIFAGRGYVKRSDENVKRLAREMRELQRKLDALLKHQGIEMPPPPASFMSPEVEQLARDPKTKIAAIALYREENPGAGLREAAELIEAFYQSKK
jgi:hypothetical protein